MEIISNGKFLSSKQLSANETDLLEFIKEVSEDIVEFTIETLQ